MMNDEKKYRIYLCGGSSCTPKGRDALLRALEDALWAAQLDDLVDVRVSGCQDRCDYAPNITIWPGPYHYSNLTPAAIEQIVAQHLLKGEPVRAFLLGEEARQVEPRTEEPRTESMAEWFSFARRAPSSRFSKGFR